MICAVERQIKVCENKTEGNRKNWRRLPETPRRSEIAATRGTVTEIFRLSRLLLLVLKEILHSYCWLTTAQVVEWPVLEPLGQLENVSPLLKNTTTVVCVVHLYGPAF
jgi:hypothetical protein